jgi:hypothetical protein
LEVFKIDIFPNIFFFVRRLIEIAVESPVGLESIQVIISQLKDLSE